MLGIDSAQDQKQSIELGLLGTLTFKIGTAALSTWLRHASERIRYCCLYCTCIVWRNARNSKHHDPFLHLLPRRGRRRKIFQRLLVNLRSRGSGRCQRPGSLETCKPALKNAPFFKKKSKILFPRCPTAQPWFSLPEGRAHGTSSSLTPTLLRWSNPRFQFDTRR